MPLLQRNRQTAQDNVSALKQSAEVITAKPFLRAIYTEWYNLLLAELPEGSAPVIELGAGGGFLRELAPNIVTSDVFAGAGLDVVLDGRHLPFAANSLRGILMTDVFHHIPDVRAFLSEARRCVHPGGVVAMLEPWRSLWSTFVYTYLHHERFEPDTTEWAFPPGHPVSDANGALPWIVFQRDREAFEGEFPEWTVARICPLMPFRYLLSGGVSYPAFVPAWSHGFWRDCERLLSPIMRWLAMFALVVLTRSDVTPGEGGDGAY